MLNIADAVHNFYTLICELNAYEAINKFVDK